MHTAFAIGKSQYVASCCESNFSANVLGLLRGISCAGRHWTLFGFPSMHDPGFVYVRAPTYFPRFKLRAEALIPCHSMVGPEFISMAAAEAENPRKLMRRAYDSFVWRLMFFFIGGALCVGIVIPYDDKILHDYVSGDRSGSGTGAAYVH